MRCHVFWSNGTSNLELLHIKQLKKQEFLTDEWAFCRPRPCSIHLWITCVSRHSKYGVGPDGCPILIFTAIGLGFIFDIPCLSTAPQSLLGELRPYQVKCLKSPWARGYQVLGSGWKMTAEGREGEIVLTAVCLVLGQEAHLPSCSASLALSSLIFSTQ